MVTCGQESARQFRRGIREDMGTSQLTRSTGLVALAALAVACASNTLDWPGSPRDTDDDDATLRRYKAAFHTAQGEEFDRSATREQFLAEVAAARVLYLGDNHRDPVLHRRHVDLLLDLRDRGVPIALGLEAVGTQDQSLVDEFLAGTRSEPSLRAAIRERWAGSWLDDVRLDMAYYNFLIRLARDSKWPVFALEPTPRLPLDERDAAIAGSILAAARAHPTRLVVVVVGQTHLLGTGALIERVDQPAVAIGASISPHLRGVAARERSSDPLVRSDGGLWFFSDHMPVYIDGP